MLIFLCVSKVWSSSYVCGQLQYCFSQMVANYTLNLWWLINCFYVSFNMKFITVINNFVVCYSTGEKSKYSENLKENGLCNLQEASFWGKYEYTFLNINIIFFALPFLFHGPSLQQNKLKHIVSPLRKKQRWKTIWDCNLPKVLSFVQQFINFFKINCWVVETQ